MKTSYRERDYTYGSAMLTLRNAIGLTQEGLAKLLGVSRRAVGEWETGNSYPKVEHLRELIELGVKQQAFPVGYEAQEIRILWKAAHQKVLLDEHWLSSILLSQSHSVQEQALRTLVEPAHISTAGSPRTGQGQGEGRVETGPAQVGRDSRDEGERKGSSLQRSSEPLRATTASGTVSTCPLSPPTVEETMGGAPIMAHSKAGPRVDWGDALTVPAFYGREQELALLSQWVMQERASIVSVLGMGGIGKSALLVSSMRQLAVETRTGASPMNTPASKFTPMGASPDPTAPVPDPTFPTAACPFEVVIFRSLRNAPSCEALIDEYLQVLSAQSLPIPIPTSTERRISLLLEHLRKTRTLLVLDNLECLLKEGDVKGHFRPGFEGYGQLLRRMTETFHQSCLLLTSREKPAELRLLEGRCSSVRSLRLAGLDAAACKRLLAEKELIGTEAEQTSLIEAYGGNPLALKIVAEVITDLFSGAVREFLAGCPLVFGGITDLLNEQFACLSALEQCVLRWLAIVREPVTLDELLAMLVIPLPRVGVFEAVDAGSRRSLIEPGHRPGSFMLQSVMLEYVTTVLISEAMSEIQQGQLDRLIEYGLELAHCKEYVRQTQERLLLSPLLMDLQSTYREQGELEERLLGLLGQLREETDFAQGYGPTNLIALLRLWRGHLNGLDLSQLIIRGAYLQGIEMQDTNLSRSLICDAVFTESTCVTCVVTISPDGKWWAASGLQGKVRVWREGGRTLHLIWQAHADMVQSLAFSPDGRVLASGSVDGMIKLWDVEACSHGASPSKALLWTGWQNSPQSLAFSPDGSLLASGGLDATVRLWHPGSGTSLQTLRHSGQVFAVAFSPDGRLLASSCCDGEIRLWEKQRAESSASDEVLSLQTSWMTSPAVCLAFAPDGKTLASANWDQTVRLWDVSSSHPRSTTLPGQMNQTRCVAWSPDGRTLASSRSDKTIWFWDVEHDRYRAVLQGHTADIYDMAFTPDSRSLLSGSADNTLRVWDVQSGQCVRVIAGYAVSLYDLDWSPDGTQLVSGGSDGQVTIWDLNGGTPLRALHGHSRIVRGVKWSPDGRFIASCGWDKILRLWDTTTLSCIQKFEDSSALLEGLAWNPDGSLLACGSYLGGMQVWDVCAWRHRWVGQTQLTAFSDVTWSPDGTRLVSGGDDGSVYLWDGADGAGQAQGIRQAQDPVSTRLSGHHGKITSVSWSPDGTQLASGGSSGELFVWSVQSRERVQIFVGHPGAVSAVAWCYSRTNGGGQGQATASILVSGGTDGRLRWWDVQSGWCVSMQAAHQGTVQSLKVSPDGRRLASCGDDGAITIWDLESAKRLQTLRRDRSYERLNITGIRGITEAQKDTLRALGAVDDCEL